MRRTVFLIALFFLAGSELLPVENDFTFDLMKSTYFTLHLLDTGLTFALEQNPCIIECNPIWKPVIDKPGLVMALDFGILIGANYLFDRIHRWNKPVSYIVLGLCVLVQGWVVRDQWRLLEQ